MSYKNEFGVVDLIINSSFETKGIDALSLAIIKSERQVRKLFTFLIYQNPNYCNRDSKKLREILTNNRQVYFKNFILGINEILNHSINELYGEDYNNDLKNITNLIAIRNKIFHGQVTKFYLTRDELIAKTNEIKKWCEKLSITMINEIGYDGFERNSYRKSNLILNLKNIEKFETYEKYECFIENICESK